MTLVFMVNTVFLQVNGVMEIIMLGLRRIIRLEELTQRVVTESTDSTFNIDASKLGVGEYSAYFSVYNGSGGYYTEKVYFTIIESNIGDVNTDGTVNIDDVTLIQKYIANISELDSEQLKAADVTGDGDISIDDVTTIQKYLAGMIAAFATE